MFFLVIYFALLNRAFSVNYLHQAGVIRADGSLRNNAWYSGIYGHECKLGCKSLSQKENSSYTEEVRLRHTCDVRCEAGLRRKQIWKNNFRRIKVQKKSSGLQSECLIGVLTEILACTRLRGSTSDVTSNSNCQRLNYRYYLPNARCDSFTPENYEEGRDTCREACLGRDPHVLFQTESGEAVSELVVDVGRMRAIFHVCYENYSPSGLPWKFCRAKLKSCKTCFQWGQWRKMTKCSCEGTVQLQRDCEVKVDTRFEDENASFNRYSKVSKSYCIAYFGGSDTKTSSCSSSTICPQWTEWGPWSGCPNNSDSTDKPKSKRCRTKRSTDDQDSLDDQFSTESFELSNTTYLFNQTDPEYSFIFVVETIPPENSTNSVFESRHRECINVQYFNGTCRGNTSQYRKIVCANTKDEEKDCLLEEDNLNTTTHSNALETSTSVTTEIIKTASTTPHTERAKDFSSSVTILSTTDIEDSTTNTQDTTTNADDGSSKDFYLYVLIIASLAVVVITLAVTLTAVCITRMVFKKRSMSLSQSSISSRNYRENFRSSRNSVQNPTTSFRLSMSTLNNMFSENTSRRSSRSDTGTETISIRPSNRSFARDGRSSTDKIIVEYTPSNYAPDMLSSATSGFSSSCCSSRNGTLRKNRNSHTTLVNAGRKQSSSSLLSSGSGIISPNSGSFPPLPPIPGTEHEGVRVKHSGSATPIESGTWRRGAKIRSESASGSVRSYSSSKYSIGRGSQRSRCGSSGRMLAESYSRKASKSRPRMPYDFVEGPLRTRRHQPDYDLHTSLDRRRRSTRHTQKERKEQESLENEYWTVARGERNIDENETSKYRVVTNILYHGIPDENNEEMEDYKQPIKTAKNQSIRGNIVPTVMYTAPIKRELAYDTMHLGSSGEKLNSSDVGDSDDYDHLGENSSSNSRLLRVKCNSIHQNSTSSLSDERCDSSDSQSVLLRTIPRTPHKYERISYNEKDGTTNFSEAENSHKIKKIDLTETIENLPLHDRDEDKQT